MAFPEAKQVLQGTGGRFLGAVWTLDSDGLLTLSGSGEMDNTTYFFSYPGVRRLVVEEGVTSIGASAFNGCIELERRRAGGC